MKNILSIALLLVAFGFSSVILTNNVQANQNKTDSSQDQKGQYSCPMHPEVMSDKKGKCPQCGMNLEKTQSKKTTKK